MSTSSRRSAVFAVLLAFVALADCTRSVAVKPVVSSRTVKGATGAAAATKASLQQFFGADLPMRSRGEFGIGDVTMESAPGTAVPRFIRVLYPAGSASQLSTRDQGAPTGGFQVYLLPTTGPTDDLYLSYAVRFEAGFRFVKGGKLPGLFGGTQVAGGDIPDGTNGFSTRYMWRKGGRGEVYAYLPSSKNYGTSLGAGRWDFLPGRWMTMQQHVHLNTPGVPDGVVEVWVDGREVFHQSGLVFRTTGTLRIDGVFFSTFFGGDDLSWASPVDQYTDFADLQVANHYITPGGGK